MSPGVQGAPPEAQSAHGGAAGWWRSVASCVFFSVLACVLLWSCGALWFQVVPDWRIPALVGAMAVALAIGWLGWRHLLAGSVALGLAVLLLAAWWSTILPSNDREWAPDVAHGVTGEVEGEDVTLHDVRFFDWHSADEGTPRWETRYYHLDQLQGVELFSSVWSNPAIAHTLIGFVFADGARVVFSAEVRRGRDQAFSEIGGFFKAFELVLIAADPDDIIRLRTDLRRERVSRFALDLTREQSRALFLSYVAMGNRLAAAPEFYQTLTTNCTTVIFKLARMIDPGIPRDWRILVSGYLPDYLYDHDIIRTDLPLDEVKRQAVIAPGTRWTPAAP
ncbi:DUF4105 domain-containing protein [Ancylobacter sp. 6x-1]|uniref:DUF4105 domain-containing protein n=1 Tax=Ancylobacter crimeensis TaxID=2579147 RepID=A0ABT0DDQ1_9HYPH|nr:DUF4105 domain-containing protein [Ancylobacter crimeensis]MCK0197882.1 DUF4105 domain-containing protein [Ancylobacter crimeensis]